MPGISLAVITFRLDRDTSLTQILSDLACLYFTVVIPMLIFQDLLIGILVQADRRERPIVPWWLGWATWVLPMGWFGVSGTYCVHDGPIAWTGDITV
jgi:hypothetical protein